MSQKEKVKPVKLVEFTSDDVSPHVPTTAELDAEEEEFRRLRVDMPGVKGASSIGIVGIGVSKTPGKNEFYRTHREFRPSVEMANHEEGMERQYFVVSTEMKVALEGIGIGVSPHTLYLTVTSRGALKVVPVRIADGDSFLNQDRILTALDADITARVQDAEAMTPEQKEQALAAIAAEQLALDREITELVFRAHAEGLSGIELRADAHPLAVLSLVLVTRG